MRWAKVWCLNKDSRTKEMSPLRRRGTGWGRKGKWLFDRREPDAGEPAVKEQRTSRRQQNDEEMVSSRLSSGPVPKLRLGVSSDQDQV